MATLKGQNLRLIINDDGDWRCIAMSTNLTATLTGNSDDTSTKDDTGMASRPEITSKSWNASVETLDVLDAAAVLRQIKSGEPFDVVWDETEAGTNKNQNSEGATFARKGKAFINDLTLTFNNRENSAKNIQFTGTGPLEETLSLETQATGEIAYTKGQFVRLFLGSDNSAAPSRVIGAALQLSLHVSLSLEEATTKDTAGDWQIQEPTGLSFDISTSALVRSGETITSTVQAQGLAELEDIYEYSLPVKFKIANTGGTNNRTATTTIVSGSVVISQLTLNAPNRQNASYEAQLTGYSDYTTGA